MPMKSVEDLHKNIGQHLLLADEHIIRLITYMAVANIAHFGPVWVCIIAPPSGGKSELVQSLFDMTNYFYPLSSLTPQTLISGMKGAGGTSNSLLDDLMNKIVVMKDLTTIVEMNKDERRAILAQMREVYDKRFDKAFGTGERKNWEGHVGWLGAITPEGAEVFGARGAMGERFIFYRMKMPDRMGVLYKAAENQSKNMELVQLELRKYFNEFLEPILAYAQNISDDDRKVLIDPESQKQIFEMANFATKARSSVRLHWKTGEVEYVHPHEMPIRFANQLIGLVAGGFIIYKFFGVEAKLTKADLAMLGDICWGSIPSHRADVLRLLAKFKQGSTKAIAAELGYDTNIVRTWLMELAGLKLVFRVAKSAGADEWYMNDGDRDLICRYSNIQKLDVAIEEKDYTNFLPQGQVTNSPEAEALALEAVEQAKKMAAQQYKEDNLFDGINPETGLPYGEEDF